jgi:uncharacterized protein YjiK
MLRRSLSIAFVLACAACGTSGSDGEATDTQDQTSSESLPLREISGLASRDGRFVAVGDRSSKLLSFELDGSKVKDVKEHSPLDAAGNSGSQLEAVAFDGKGNIVALSESGDVFVIDEDGEHERDKTTLDWQSVNSLVDGRVDINSLGEGVIVLSKDHLLVALEKSPTAIVEFGPKGDDPRGYSSGDRNTSEFDPPKELVALKAWKVDDDHAPDLSELTIGPDGALWGLSQQSNEIVRFEGTLKPSEERASVKDHVSLPSKIKGAEGLTFDGKRPIIARDRSSNDSTNLYILEALH